MKYFDFFNRFTMDTSLADELGFNPYYINISSGLDDPIIINGDEYINLASNNYLGLASDPRVKQAMKDSIDKYGATMCGTPIATGYNEVFVELEQRTSEFVGLEDSIIFPSGYQANYSLFPIIVGRDDLVIVDHYAHASLIQGIKSIGCKIKPFKHNNMEHLETVLKRSQDFKFKYIVTESVFSTEGSIAPFTEIVELAEKYNAIPIIDDSHGIGVIGKTGHGILEEKGITDYNGIYTASLGKAMAGTGGIISGKKSFIKYLRYQCSGLIYSTALPPVVASGLISILDILKSKPGKPQTADSGQQTADSSSKTEHELRLEIMWGYKHRIRDALVEAGFSVADGAAPITSILGGDLVNTIKITKQLFENRILTTPFVPPSVPPKGGKIRLIAGANLKPETIDNVVDIIKNKLKD